MGFGNLNCLNNLSSLGSTGAGSTPFNPNTIAGLYMWFKADANIYSDSGTTPVTNGGTVQQWNDQTINARNLVAGNKPTFNTNVKNGLPIVTFDGVANYLNVSTVTLNQPQHIFIMFRQVTWQSGGRVFDGNVFNSGILYQNGSTPQLSMYDGASFDVPSPNVNTFCIYDTLFNGASSAGRLNNGTKTVGNAGGTSNMGGLTLGAGGQFFINWGNIGVGEVLVYNAALSDSNAGLVIGYLNTKWNVF